MILAANDVCYNANCAKLSRAIDERCPRVLWVLAHGEVDRRPFDGAMQTVLGAVTSDPYHPQASQMRMDEFGNILRQAALGDKSQGHLECVVLQSCFSYALGHYLSHQCHVPYVICWLTRVQDSSCTVFTEGFSNALLSGHTFYEAYWAGVRRILEEEMTIGDPWPVLRALHQARQAQRRVQRSHTGFRRGRGGASGSTVADEDASLRGIGDIPYGIPLLFAPEEVVAANPPPDFFDPSTGLFRQVDRGYTLRQGRSFRAEDGHTAVEAVFYPSGAPEAAPAPTAGPSTRPGYRCRWPAGRGSSLYLEADGRSVLESHMGSFKYGEYYRDHDTISRNLPPVGGWGRGGEDDDGAGGGAGVSTFSGVSANGGGSVGRGTGAVSPSPVTPPPSSPPSPVPHSLNQHFSLASRTGSTPERRGSDDTASQPETPQAGLQPPFADSPGAVSEEGFVRTWPSIIASLVFPVCRRPRETSSRASTPARSTPTDPAAHEWQRVDDPQEAVPHGTFHETAHHLHEQHQQPPTGATPPVQQYHPAFFASPTFLPYHAYQRVAAHQVGGQQPRPQWGGGGGGSLAEQGPQAVHQVYQMMARHGAWRLAAPMGGGPQYRASPSLGRETERADSPSQPGSAYSSGTASPSASVGPDPRQSVRQEEEEEEDEDDAVDDGDEEEDEEAGGGEEHGPSASGIPEVRAGCGAPRRTLQVRRGREEITAEDGEERTAAAEERTPPVALAQERRPEETYDESMESLSKRFRLRGGPVRSTPQSRAHDLMREVESMAAVALSNGWFEDALRLRHLSLEVGLVGQAAATQRGEALATVGLDGIQQVVDRLLDGWQRGVVNEPLTGFEMRRPTKEGEEGRKEKSRRSRSRTPSPASQNASVTSESASSEDEGDNPGPARRSRGCMPGAKDGWSIVVVGGRGQGPMEALEEWKPELLPDATAPRSTLRPGLPAARSSFAAALTPHGIVLVGGVEAGKVVASVLLVDPARPDEAPRTLAPFPVALQEAAACFIPDLFGAGAVFVAGGWSGSAEQMERYALYDIERNEWFATPRMRLRTPRRSHAAVYSQALRKVILLGGIDDRGETLRSCDAWNPLSRQWTSLGDMTRARSQLAVAELYERGGQCTLYVSGGTSSLDARGTARSMEWFDLSAYQRGEAFRWQGGVSMRKGRVGHALVMSPRGDRMFALGGLKGTFNPFNRRTIEQYSISGDQWELVEEQGKLSSGRGLLAAFGVRQVQEA